MEFQTCTTAFPVTIPVAPVTLIQRFACIEDPLLIRQILSHVQQRDGPADFDARGPPGAAIVA